MCLRTRRTQCVRTNKKKSPSEEEERAPSVGSECKIFLSFLPSSPRRWEKMALKIVEEEEEEEAGVASGEGVMMEAGEVDISLLLRILNSPRWLCRSRFWLDPIWRHDVFGSKICYARLLRWRGVTFFRTNTIWSAIVFFCFAAMVGDNNGWLRSERGFVTCHRKLFRSRNNSWETKGPPPAPKLLETIGSQQTTKDARDNAACCSLPAMMTPPFFGLFRCNNIAASPTLSSSEEDRGGATS